MNCGGPADSFKDYQLYAHNHALIISSFYKYLFTDLIVAGDENQYNSHVLNVVRRTIPHLLRTPSPPPPPSTPLSLLTLQLTRSLQHGVVHQAWNGVEVGCTFIPTYTWSPPFTPIALPPPPHLPVQQYGENAGPPGGGQSLQPLSANHVIFSLYYA